MFRRFSQNTVRRSHSRPCFDEILKEFVASEAGFVKSERGISPYKSARCLNNATQLKCDAEEPL